MIHTYTKTLLETDPIKLQLLSPVSWLQLNASSTTIPENTNVPATPPADMVVVNDRSSYMKIIPFGRINSSFPIGKIIVVGYSDNTYNSAYIPHILFEGSLTYNNSLTNTQAITLIGSSGSLSQAVGSLAYCSVVGSTNNNGSPLNSTSSPAALLVDTAGCKLIKVLFTTTSTSTGSSAVAPVNAWIGWF